MNLRCSSLPLFMKCAASLRGDVNVSEWFPETVLGTAAHDAAARMVAGTVVDLEAIATLHGVDQGELGGLFVAASRAWKSLRPQDGQGATTHAEIPMSMMVGDIMITGQADVVVDYGPGDAVRVIDWKSGRRDADHREQIMGYCALALEAYPQADGAMGTISWLRTQEHETYSMNRRDLVAWKERLAVQVRDTSFKVGNHCQYCPRKHTCPGREDMQRGALAVVMGTRAALLREMTPAKQLEIYRQAKQITNIAYDVINEVKAIVGESGPIEGTDTTLALVEESRRTIDALKAWPIMQRYLTDAQIAEAITIQVTALTGAAGGARKQLFDELETAGAITMAPTKKLTERRKR
jgi:hypothetical protein